MPTAREDAAATLGLDGRIYVIGGIDGTGTTIRTVEAYDPTHNTWTTVSPLPGARDSAEAVTGPDGRIYVIGGTDSTGARRRTVFVYNPRSQFWTTVTSIPSPSREDIAAAVGLNGRIYSIGGDSSGTTFLRRVDMYDLSSNSWTRVSNTVFPGRNSSGAARGPLGRIYIVGGKDSSSRVPFVDVYNPAADFWTVGPDMPTPSPNPAGSPDGGREDMGVAAGLDGRIYAIGGNDNNLNAVRTVQVLKNINGGTAAAVPVKFPPSVSTDPVFTMDVAVPPTVTPLLEAPSQGLAPSSRAGDDTALRHGTDAGFAVGTDSPSADLADALFAGSIG
jgi:hypothetical protein